MPYQRRRPRIPSTGRVALWLTPEQRDLFLQAAGTPKELGHALHRAPIKNGKLSLRVTRQSLDALIAVAAHFEIPNRAAERALATLLRYLESLEERFEDVSDASDPETESAIN